VWCGVVALMMAGFVIHLSLSSERQSVRAYRIYRSTFELHSEDCTAIARPPIMYLSTVLGGLGQD